MPDRTATGDPAESRRLRRRSFPIHRQLDTKDCGPTCLQMIASYHGKRLSLRTLRDLCSLNRQGVSLLGISYAAERLGFRSLSTKASFEQLVADAPLPCIAHWDQEHFVVVYRATATKVHVADPARGRITHSAEQFQQHWCSVHEAGRALGILMLLEPTAAFEEQEEDEAVGGGRTIRYMLTYCRRYRRFFFQVLLGMLVAAVLQLIFPFLTQAIVDHGIANRDIGFIYLVLIAQLALFFSRTGVEFIRNRILFHVGTRIYVSILSDFLMKMMRLPISFFDGRMMGDLVQRVHDHHRLEQFLTTTTLNVVFSMFTLVAFTIVLAIFDLTIVLVFLAGSVLHVAYVSMFLRRRKEIDYQRFSENSKHQNALYELIRSMPEIKLNNAEQQKRWDWERIQARLFKVNLRGLTLDQSQDGGAVFINELKNITLTFLAAKLVIDGEMTLGMLIAVQYIIGQLNAPLSQLIRFAQSTQDAKISLERLSEVHERQDEEDVGTKITTLPTERTLRVNGLAFTYGGPVAPLVLRDLDIEIPEGKVTAIVGASGSGKTTFIKLLLKFYDPSRGEIFVGGSNLRNLSNRLWRASCGVVMQDGRLFSDTIARNVAVGEDRVEVDRLMRAVSIANIQPFIESLPAAFNTRVGSDGVGLSQGQKQRLLIARAVYKDPEYLFFDEATSALDARNERAIIENLDEFFCGRTAVVVAHRLSTVKNADQIVVLDEGRIVERGTHDELTTRRGEYYRLVKNQLELGV